MIHYHGTPITPRDVLDELSGKHFCVSHASPNDVRTCCKIGQSVMLDNGAFSKWRAGREPDFDAYLDWVQEWLWPANWCVIPDVIDGSLKENDGLVQNWPLKRQSAPVWHTNEPVVRLIALCRDWPLVCVGSTSQYGDPGDKPWCFRMDKVFNDLLRTFNRIPPLHMLRGMSLAGSQYPFASCDSTDIARNHNRPHNGARKMADKWDAQQCPGTWELRAVQMVLDTPAAPS